MTTNVNNPSGQLFISSASKTRDTLPYLSSTIVNIFLIRVCFDSISFIIIFKILLQIFIDFLSLFLTENSIIFFDPLYNLKNDSFIGKFQFGVDDILYVKLIFRIESYKKISAI